ncbi:MAG: indolepyruvate ferredoxin oxidoreductase subunit alpha [Syntrophaceae bacterium]|nr:indolepyruvate ferredoxin oxidoreductase subunit alpha [Syntrophaceae bacterium]
MVQLMSGNEAIARGAYECGVRFASGYPGTPSTEIMEAFSKYEGVYAEWSPNEKVALEVGIGAALAGAKALVIMKHVGVNVAADPLFTVSYTGTNGALVIITADDPSAHSSQNEQDNRNYAKFAKIPMLEPADSEEARKYIKLAFEISEKFDTPVFLRSTTRVSHSKSVVSIEEPCLYDDKTAIRYNQSKYVMVPMNARIRRIEVEKRLNALKKYAEVFPENKIEINDNKIGIITAGMPYNYAKDVYPDVSYLKLGMVYPLPDNLIKKFSEQVEKIFVAEELDPFIEEQIKASGIDVRGKDMFPYTIEFDPGIIKKAMSSKNEISQKDKPDITIPQRPPNLCPGCPHRGLFYVLGKLNAFVTGDIGCYTLSFMEPLNGLNSCICMGASIGMAHGMSKALKEKGKGKIVGVIGDSTFIHSGITSLLNVAYNNSDAVIVICDNRTTAMTGMQEHPATGSTLLGEKAKKLNFAALAEVLGIESIRVIDPYDLKTTRTVMKEELSRPGPSVVISRRSCVLSEAHQRKEAKEEKRKPLKILAEKCNGCRLCLGLGCPPISWKQFSSEQDASTIRRRKKQEGYAVIDENLCTGCTLCQQLCKSGAIV